MERQDRRSQVEVVSEFKQVLEFFIKDPATIEKLQKVVSIKAEATLEGMRIPKEAKLIRLDEFRDGSGRIEQVKAVLGVYRTPAESVREAKKAQHPFNAPATVPVDVALAMCEIISAGPTKMELMRDEVVELKR